VNTKPVQRAVGVFAMKRNTQGSARAMCSGRAMRFGTSPLKISQRWNTMEVAPKTTQKAWVAHPREVSMRT
jgi:hypothetical protein